MTHDMMTLRLLLEKTSDADLLREMTCWNTSPGNAASIPQSSSPASDSASSAPTTDPMPTSSLAWPSAATEPEPNYSALSPEDPSTAWRPDSERPRGGFWIARRTPPQSALIGIGAIDAISAFELPEMKGFDPQASPTTRPTGSALSNSTTSHADTTPIRPATRLQSASCATTQPSDAADLKAQETGTKSCNNARAQTPGTALHHSSSADPRPGYPRPHTHTENSAPLPEPLQAGLPHREKKPSQQQNFTPVNAE